MFAKKSSGIREHLYFIMLMFTCINIFIQWTKGIIFIKKRVVLKIQHIHINIIAFKITVTTVEGKVYEMADLQWQYELFSIFSYFVCILMISL